MKEIKRSVYNKHIEENTTHANKIEIWRKQGMRKRAKRVMGVVLIGALTLSMLAGCGSDKDTSVKNANSGEDEIVTLKWYNYLDKVAPDTEKVIAELNEYTREKIGVEIDYTAIGNPDYTEKMPTMINAGEYFDICFTANWTTNYQQFATKGAFMDITELLPQYAPELYEVVPEALWKAAAVNGAIYGVPSYKEMGWQGGVLVNSDMADAYGIDLTQVKKFEDLGPVFQTVKEKSEAENKNIIGTSSLEFKTVYPFESLTGNPNLPGVYSVEELNYFEEKEGVFNQYDTQEYKEYCATVRDWYLKGYFNDDPVNYSSDLTNDLNDFASGKLFSRHVTYSPGLEDSEAERIGHDVAFIPFNNPLLDTQGAQGGFQAVSSASKYPEKALEFLNLVNTDVYVGTLLRHGLEGEHHTVVGENQIDRTMGGTIDIADNGYDYISGWQFGTIFNQKWDISYPDNIEELYQEYNDSAVKAPHLGFNMDQVPVESEIAALTSVVQEYTGALGYGMVDPEIYIPKFLKDLEANGASKVMDEVTTQMEAFEKADK